MINNVDEQSDIGFNTPRCPNSSVGRAGDWKSPCPWFDSEFGHHLSFVRQWLKSLRGQTRVEKYNLALSLYVETLKLNSLAQIKAVFLFVPFTFFPNHCQILILLLLFSSHQATQHWTLDLSVLLLPFVLLSLIATFVPSRLAFDKPSAWLLSFSCWGEAGFVLPATAKILRMPAISFWSVLFEIPSSWRLLIWSSIWITNTSMEN